VTEYVPIKLANKALEAFNNWGQYMKALYDQKVTEKNMGMHGDGMDIMGSLVRSETASENENDSPSRAEKGQAQLPGLTEENILGNSFVMLLGMRPYSNCHRRLLTEIQLVTKQVQTPFTLLL
jgi:hypothetical protein